MFSIVGHDWVTELNWIKKSELMSLSPLLLCTYLLSLESEVLPLYHYFFGQFCDDRPTCNLFTSCFLWWSFIKALEFVGLQVLLFGKFGDIFPKYFFVPTFFSPMGTLTTHLLACLKLLHNSLMLFNYSGFFLCGVCLFVWFGLDCFHCYAIKLINLVVVIQSLSHIWFCNPMDCSIRGFPVLHYLLELAQIHVHWVGDAI